MSNKLIEKAADNVRILSAAMVEKANGTYVMLGFEEGMKVSDGNEYTSGVAKADRNGHLISLVCQENEELPDVDATIAATLIAQSSYAA